MSISLVTPSLDEMTFRRALLADTDTMSYNHAYGGTIDFPPERWQTWYDRWVRDTTGARFYRYIRDDSTGEYVGEAAYHMDDDGRCMCDVIVMACHRGHGYGSAALRALCNAARTSGIARLYDTIACDNPALSLFMRAGFTVDERTPEYTLVHIDL